MNTLNIIYNKKSDFILPIVEEFKGQCYIDLYNMDTYKYRSVIKKMQEEFGSKNYPLIIIQNENLQNIDAIWSESDPDWKKEITKKLKRK
jgi:hypothetical protein